MGKQDKKKLKDLEKELDRLKKQMKKQEWMSLYLLFSK